ncbi:MAG: hypothetical protein SNJ77_04575, partial [Cytophagales bacterium]
MKKKFLIIGFVLGFLPLTAQMGINTMTPHNSAAFEISSPNKGLLIPRWESAAFNQDKNNLVGGLLAVEENTSLLKIFNKTVNQWQTVGGWQMNATQQPYTMQNVGIGTSSPNERLDVNGRIIANELFLRGGRNYEDLKWYFHSHADDRHALFIAPRDENGGFNWW